MHLFRHCYAKIIPVLSGVITIFSSQIYAQAKESEHHYLGKPLISVLNSFNKKGLKLIYSSIHVHNGMVIRKTHSAESDIILVKDILSEFSLTLKSGPQNSYIIIKKKIVPPLEVPKKIQTKHEKLATTIEKMVISASQFDLAYTNVSQQQFMEQKDIERLSLLGNDVNRAISQLPGVAGGDISARLHIRGGTSQENLFLLDGMPLSDPFHIKEVGGILGIIDAFSIGNAKIITGGATVMYGDHLSGITELTSNSYEQENPWAMSINLLDFKVKGSGEFNNEDSWFFVARKGGFNKVAAHSDVDFGDSSPKYSDSFAKINIELSYDTLLTGHSLLSQDNLICLDDCLVDEDSGSSNEYHWINLETQWNNNLTSQSLFGIANLQSQYITGFSIDDTYVLVDDSLEWGFEILKQDWQYHFAQNHMIMAGIEIKSLYSNYNYESKYQFIDPFSSQLDQFGKVYKHTALNIKGRSYAVYFSDRFKVNEALTIEPGLRWDKQTYADEQQFSPRINFDYSNSSNNRFKFSWGVYQQAQGIQQLQVEDGIETFRPVQKVKKMNLTYQSTILEEFGLMVSFYQKNYVNPLPRFENILLMASQEHGELNLDRQAHFAKWARSKGVETILTNNSDKFNWRLSYVLSKAEEKINKEIIPRKWDQRHAIKFSSNYQLSNTCDLSFAANYHTGWRATKVTLNPDYYDGSIDDAPWLMGKTYDAKYKDYLRIDVGVGCEVKYEGGRIRYSFGALNLFNRANASGTSAIKELFSSQDLVYGLESSSDNTYIPFIPTINFIWEF